MTYKSSNGINEYVVLQNQWVPGPAAVIPFRRLPEMQIFRPHPRPSESETLGMGPSDLLFKASPLGDSNTAQV